MLNFLRNGYGIITIGNGNEENVLEEYIMLTLQAENDFAWGCCLTLSKGQMIGQERSDPFGNLIN